MTTVGAPARSKYDLEDRTLKFAKRVRIFAKKLPKSVGNAEDIPQLIRSSGSVAANYIEANESLGRKDFLMRVRICLKESKESALWIGLCETGGVMSINTERDALYDEAKQLVRIFSTILRNAERNASALNAVA
ncbi:four helix bundle protein [Candidatus Peregrinibacteria bacterium]|nr:four helix bundle protein [Candidatus Peregrinibacteria bacterium]